MAQVTGEIVIDRPVDEVFDFVADERNEPRYNPRMVSAEKTTPGPVGRGTRYRARAVSMGRPTDMTIEISDYDRPRRLESATSLSAMDIHGTLTFEPSGGGTLMRWSWRLAPHGALRLLGPLIARIGRRQEAQVWGGLKRYLEARD